MGSAVNFDGRVATHISSLNSHTHKNRHLQAAWDKYGADTFTFECIEECLRANVVEREQYWINFYNASNPEYGYNICPIAGNTLGIRQSCETRDKIRRKAIGRIAPDEMKRKMSASKRGCLNPMYGHHHTEQAREKMKRLKDGSKKSVAFLGTGNPFYGKHHSDETKRLISSKRQGKRTRVKLSAEDVKEIKTILASKPGDVSWNNLFETIGKQYSV
ncbi:MAG: NUMOD3 domain-containing DNA-binding protein, partial [Lachnospiraceae bacterium]|nr:NUMOD3 domain-containing DNA-binding protein [Lachnospiraceae bacterium]